MGPAQPAFDGSVSCGYCGFRDTLPSDQLGRALEVKRRLAAAKNSVANVEGMNGVLSEIYEKRSAFWGAAGFYLAVAVLISGFSYWNARPYIDAAPEGFKLGLTLNALMGGLWIGGFAVALFAAHLVGRSVYRKKIRMALFARLPRQEGMPARCRACDGNLPDRRDAFTLCEFCGTKNLVTPELAANRHHLLERERAFYAQRSGQAIGGMRAASIKMSRVLIICGVITYIAVIGLAYLASMSFPTG